MQEDRRDFSRSNKSETGPSIQLAGRIRGKGRAFDHLQSPGLDAFLN